MSASPDHYRTESPAKEEHANEERIPDELARAGSEQHTSQAQREMADGKVDGGNDYDAEDTGEQNQEQYHDQGEEQDQGQEQYQDDGGKDNISDDESVLSDVDEEQFQDFDPANVEIDDRPQLAIDEENLKLIGRHKRARHDEDPEYEEKRRKRKEGRREKRSRRKNRDEDELGGGLSGGEEGEGGEGRRGGRKKKERRSKPYEQEIDMDALDPETRRKVELDRLMDEQLKKPTKRRAKKDGIDLADLADAEIEDMRRRMTDAARLDGEARKEGKPAMHKLRMLPEVVSLLNRNQYINSLVDPEINLLEAVKFFLEPLDDGSLPAYNIQRDLLNALSRLPINKETLIASGIGKVVLFYTKSKRPEVGIKRLAERLLAEWSRPILQRSDDYSKRVFQTAEFDPRTLAQRSAPISAAAANAAAAEARARELLPPRLAMRARAEAGPTSYTIVPKSTVVQEGKFARPLGASGEDRFRRMKARQVAAAKGKARR
ncbi:Transcription factor iws1 [Ascosphaera atra]|nr:Transcription factor iws1 [Ascosphaera atra]